MGDADTGGIRSFLILMCHALPLLSLTVDNQGQWQEGGIGVFIKNPVEL
jgi:hypothetical protein